MTDEATLEPIAEDQDEPELADEDLPDDDEEDEAPPPRDASVTPVDPDAPGGA